MAFFSQIEASKLPLRKKAWLPLIFFSDFNNPCQVLLFTRNNEPPKIISVLANIPGTADNKPEFLIPSRDAQNVGVVAKVGTVLNNSCYFKPKQGFILARLQG